MRYTKNIAAALLVLALILLLATSFYITPTAISDTDPSTYVIVPTLMLPLFVLFSLKNNPEPHVTKKDVAIGVAAFALFIVLSITLRLYFGIFFISFRLDMLLLPLALGSLILLLFGSSNLRKFRGVMLYSLLASPAILYPILIQSNAFTQFNTVVVYRLLKVFFSSVQYVPPLAISANGYSIGIGQACVSIGIFIGLALFLITVAYLYKGDDKKKLLWVASGIVLLLLLNLLRMVSISFLWLKYGPNATTLLIHSIIGVLLFYVTIVVLILCSRFYGLGFDAAKKKRRAERHSKIPAGVVLVALVLALAYAFLTINYSTALRVSPISLGNRVAFNYSNPQISGAIKALLNRNGLTSIVLASSNGTYALFSISNSTISPSQPILLFFSPATSNAIAGLQDQNIVTGRMSFFNKLGQTEQVFTLISNSTQFVVYHTNLPFVLSNTSSSIAGVSLIIPQSVLPQTYSCQRYDQLYSYLLNIPNLKGYNQTVRQNLLATECVSDKIVWS